ncbi:SIS domain-containing protein [Agrobacterium larrymoorei]|uniref:SIS domain-containing protein n=1 Tax=Agrobacterium larrymoorei TaxID=160699 RepID=A0A4D7E185_9HYPH|nr:SIS domain-containing protein [Agrobacterium larrymoorei]QCJ01005.1 SIS domain-containing protein [Agrobacterium larrymoorei]QYA10341.1 SIS domain-containing protein [Agrobacterium larrymoorei]
MDVLYNPTADGAAAKITKQLEPAIEQLEDVAKAGRDLAALGLRQVFFVSAGAGLAIGESLIAYTDGAAQTLQFTSHAASAFVDLMGENPSIANASDTLVILSSKSGGTPETVEAAKLLQDKTCKTVVFTKSSDTKLASYGHMAFFAEETTQAFHATHMLMAAFTGGILEEKETWRFMPALASTLKALPAALLHAAMKGMSAGHTFAEDFKEDTPLYVIASGSGVLVPRAFGLCVLEERFGFDVHAIQASDFFHSVVETVRADKETVRGNTKPRFILTIPEDRSRGRMLDIKTFFEESANDLEVTFHVIDTKDLDTSGIDPEILKIVGPLLCEAYLKPWAPILAGVTKKTMNDPLIHMGRFKYYNCHLG